MPLCKFFLSSVAPLQLHHEFRKVGFCRGAILRLFLMSTSGGTPRKYAVNLHHISEAPTLDDQAKALGIHRSTAWTIVKTKHKLGRLSTKTTKRILANPATPASVRAIVQRYLAERSDIVEYPPPQSRSMSSYHFTDRQRISVTGPSGNSEI